MDDSKWERWSALGGILFVVLILVAVFLPGSPPKPSDSAVKMAKFVHDNADQIRWAGYVGALGAVAILWWLGAVWRILRRAEGGRPRLAMVAVTGGVFAALSATLSGVLLGVVAIVGVGGSGGTTGTRFFYLLSTSIGSMTNFGTAIFAGAASAVIIRTGVLPKALGWLGAVVALLALVGGASVASTRDAIFGIGFAAFFGFMLWVLIASILILRGAGSEQVASAA
jgi:hypothetical protein